MERVNLYSISLMKSKNCSIDPLYFNYTIFSLLVMPVSLGKIIYMHLTVTSICPFIFATSMALRLPPARRWTVRSSTIMMSQYPFIVFLTCRVMKVFQLFCDHCNYRIPNRLFVSVCTISKASNVSLVCQSES